jgi:diguanylate cyclase (GGDEF)-like protein
MSVINKTEDPLFMLNVTMQNHSAYGGTYDNFDPQITASFKKTSSTKYLNNYLSLMYETDMATETLIHKLEALDEPTIVCFYGDHQPNDYVVKPIVADILMRRVNNVMESRYQYKKMLKQYYNVVEHTTADPLTHLYSKSTAEEMIMRIIKDNPDKCHALIVMDVDDFKELNDEHGHSYGDVVLINLADRMKKFFRTGDVLARATGFQFCMFMQDVPSAIIAEKKCQELLAEISKMRIGKKQISVTCSLGIAITENKPMKFGDLYERAEVALVEAKKLGKSQTMISKGLPMEP